MEEEKGFEVCGSVESIASGMEVPMPWWASWSSEEHRVSYSLPGVRWVAGVLKPWVLVHMDISSTPWQG